ncbi:MAG: uncharacterized protein JWM86_2800, partial [Thermoleophilia bacterium]|nr:uncharacterized protein [Thermoleophilia bacterium]
MVLAADVPRVRVTRGISVWTRRWLCHLVVPAIFAAVLVPSATAMSEARVVERAAATPTAKATSSRSLRASSRIGCTRTIGATGTRRLSAAQRLQVRRLGAYRIAATPRTARRAAVPAQWICVRTAAQAKALAGLTRSLGHREAKADLDVQAVALPRTLDRKLTIALPDRASAGWTMLDAPAVPAQSFDKGVVYSAGEYDVVQRVSFGSLKESIAVHRRQGIRSWSWKLAWKGGAAPSIGRDGTVRYGEGVVIAAPFIQDARGRRVRDLAWKLDGTTLSVTFNDASLPLPYVLDPASSYPQFLYPSSVGSDYVPGSTTINGMYSPPRNPADTGDQVVDIDDPAGSEYMFWSNSTNNVIEAAPVTNATHPNPMDGAPPIGNGSGYGGYGWSQEALGGVTLPTGPYTVQARVAVSSATADNVTLALKARVWKVRATPSDANFVEISQAPGPVPITSWTQGPSQVYNLNGQTRDLLVPNMTVNPGSNVLGVSDHVFLELALVVVDQGANNTTASLHTSSVNTFLNFGAAAGNTAGTAAGQVVGAPSTMTAGGWTNDNTPRLRANLDDPDWWHHLNFQVCNVATCATQLQTGNSTFGQIAGSTTNFWDTAALPDGGPYYFRARTVEDDAVQNGDDQVGAFNNYTATTCAGPDVGPCGQFRVDTVAPGGAITSPATGSTNRGTVTVSGTSTDATSGVVTHSLQWRRISPAAAGPLATGIACAGASTPAWSCTWDTTTVIDGDYELRLTVTDAATNAATIVSSTYKVDNTAPVFPGGAFSNDGPAADVTYVSSLTTLVSNWSAATDANGINRYEYCLSTLTGCAGTITKNWTSNAMALNQTSGSLTLTEGTTYYSCVRALDAAGNASTPLCSNGQTVDTLPPAVPTTVNDGPAADITWLPSTTTAQANWSGGGDTGSGLNRWEYCISTATNCGGTVAKTWTSTGLTTNMTSGSLALTEGQQYFVCVRAFDNIGNQSA